MTDIFSRIKKINLPRGEYAIFGSALLDVWGIRTAADLDIIVTPELYASLKQGGWEERQAHGFPMLSREEANVTTVQGEPTDGDYCPDRRQLIKDAVHINEVPFVKIEEVIACKKAYGRPKDIKDIAAIGTYLKNCGEKNPYHVAG